jgi:hypothetical protein
VVGKWSQHGVDVDNDSIRRTGEESAAAVAAAPSSQPEHAGTGGRKESRTELVGSAFTCINLYAQRYNIAL